MKAVFINLVSILRYYILVSYRGQNYGMVWYGMEPSLISGTLSASSGYLKWTVSWGNFQCEHTTRTIYTTKRHRTVHKYAIWNVLLNSFLNTLSSHVHERTVHCSTRQKEGSRLLAERCWRRGDHWGGVPWGSGVCGGVFGWEATASVLFQRLTRHSQEARGSHGPYRKTNAPHPFFPSLRSDVINYHQNARDSERECVSLFASVCVSERERKNERGSGKERDHCLRWNKEISTEPLWTGKAGKCTKMQGLVSYSWAVTSCQEPTNSDVQMQTALPSDIHCTPVIYYILTSVTLACIWTSKRVREWSFSSLANIRCVHVSLWLLGYN